MFRRLWEFHNKYSAEIVVISSMVEIKTVSMEISHREKPRPLSSTNEANEFNE